MLLPVGSIASTMERDLREEEFGGEPAVKTEKLSLKTDAVSARWRARYAANARSRLLPAISYA